MSSVFESLSACLYAAGAALMIAAAAVYKKNGLYEYYCLMHGKPVRAKGTRRMAGKPARRGTAAGVSQTNATREDEGDADRTPKETGPEKPEGGTQVLDGSADTTLLGKEESLTGKKALPAKSGRTWGKPTARFRVTKSEVAIHTDKTIRTRAKGEKDEG